MLGFQRGLKTNLLFLIIGDIGIIISALFLSILFRFEFSIPDNILNLLTINSVSSIIILKLFFFKIFGLYRGMWRFTSIWDLLT